MMSDCEKRYLNSMNTANPLNLNDTMSDAERSLEIIRYLKEVVKCQPLAYNKDIEEANAFLDKLSVEYEIEDAWMKHQKD